jgi:hypothetical protein
MSTTIEARKKLTIARAQENLYSLNVASRVCKVNSKDMGTIYNPYTSLPAVTSGTVLGSSYSVNDYVAAGDTLEVNRRAKAAEHVDSYDYKSWVGEGSEGLIRDRADNFGSTISNEIDRFVFSNVVGNGGFALGDSGVNGSTTAWESTSTTVDDILNASIEQVDINEGHGLKKFMVVSPYEANDLRKYMQGTGNAVMDDALRTGGFSRTNGFVGTTFSGVDVYQTNNLKNQVVLTMDTNPTAGDTMTINGVVITFQTTLGTGAGAVHVASTVDITRANLAEFLTGTSFPGDTSEAENTDTGYVKLSDADSAKLSRLGLTAVNSNAADTLTLTSTGTLVVSETFTAGTNVFGNVSRYLVAGAYESIYLALPTIGMEFVEKDVSGKAGKELYMEQFFNSKIWTRKAPLVGTILVR